MTFGEWDSASVLLCRCVLLCTHLRDLVPRFRRHPFLDLGLESVCVCVCLSVSFCVIKLRFKCVCVWMQLFHRSVTSAITSKMREKKLRKSRNWITGRRGEGSGLPQRRRRASVLRVLEDREATAGLHRPRLAGSLRTDRRRQGPQAHNHRILINYIVNLYKYWLYFFVWLFLESC